MTALTANTALQLRSRAADWKRGSAVIATSAVIYHHALVDINALGLAQPSANNTTTSFVGIADIENPTGSGGLTGDGSTVIIEFIYGGEALLPCQTNVTIGLGQIAVYAADDNTITSDNTLGPQVGTLVECPATNTAWVAIKSAAMAKGV